VGALHTSLQQYTEDVLRQPTEVVLDDLADPASDTKHIAGLRAFYYNNCASFLLRFDTHGDGAFLISGKGLSGMPRYQRPQQPIDPYKSQPLPLGRPVAVYYHQSSEGQIGNISTTSPTV